MGEITGSKKYKKAMRDLDKSAKGVTKMAKGTSKLARELENTDQLGCIVISIITILTFICVFVWIFSI